MKVDKNHWTITEQQIFILLLYANADSAEDRLEKTQDAIALHKYSHKELKINKNIVRSSGVET